MKMLYIFFTTFVLLLLLLFFIVKIFYKVGIRKIDIREINYVKIINVDKAVERRQKIEKMINNDFNGKLFNLTPKELFMSATYGKDHLLFEELDDNGNIIKTITGLDMYENPHILKNNVKYKVYDKREPDFYITYKYNPETIFFKRKKKNRHLCLGEFGCLFSHLRFIKYFAESKEKYGIVFEDDFYLKKDFFEKLNKILQKAPSNFGILKLDMVKGGHKNTHYPSFLLSIIKYGYNDYFYNANTELFGSSNTKSYIVSKQFANDLLNWIQKNDINGSEGCSDMLFYKALPRKYNFKNIWIIKDNIVFDFATPSVIWEQGG